MIVSRLVPMLVFLGFSSFGLVIALLMLGGLGFYWSVRPMSLTPGGPAIERIVPVPAAPSAPDEGMV